MASAGAGGTQTKLTGFPSNYQFSSAGAGGTQTKLTGFQPNSNTGTKSSFNFSKSSFGLNQNKQLIQEDKTLNQLENESKDNPDYKRAIKIIIDLDELVNDNSKKIKPLEGADAFEKKLVELEDDTKRAIVHTIMALGREIDHGNELIAEYRDKLGTFMHDSDAASNSSRVLPSPFLVRYVDSLTKRASNIKQSIQSFTEYLDSPSSTQLPQMLTYVLGQQYEAIVRCSARISQIQEKSDEIQAKMKNILKSKNVTESAVNDENEHDKPSVSKTIMDDYDKFQKDRDRNLQKRNTNKELWAKPQQAKSGFGFSKFGSSFGSRSGGFGSSFGSSYGSGGFGSSNKSGFGSSNSSGFGSSNKSGNTQ